MTKFAGLNFDSAKGFSNGYGPAFARVNANHIRIFPWSHFSSERAADLNALKNVLDLAQSFELSVTVVLNLVDTSALGEGRCFIRGYPIQYNVLSYSYSMDLTKTEQDFLRIYNAVGSHPAIHSWDIHNEPQPNDYWSDSPYSVREWCMSTVAYIKSVDTYNRPVYLGIDNIQASNRVSYNGKNMIQDSNSYIDYCAFHYYPQQAEHGVQWTPKQAAYAITSGPRPFSQQMQIIRQNNIKNLPVVLDEFGVSTSPTTTIAYTTEAGQAALCDALFKQIPLYPEITGINIWTANFDSPFSIFHSDSTDKLSALVTKDFYASFAR